MKKLISALIACFLAVSASAATIYVDANGTGDYPTIQDAIDDANNGDEIVLLPGIYTGEGNRDIDFKGKAVTVRSENGPNNCIIDCNGTEAERHRGFYFHSGEDANSIVDGFTITNGHTEYGGGIYCNHSSPTITNCTFSGNSVSGYFGRGGGMYNDYGDPTIINCTFIGNSASWRGGGMYNADGDLTITNCTFSGNSASDYFAYGGGVYNDDGNLTITNCTFSGNSARAGGGMYNSGDLTLTNCTFSGNSVRFGGSGGGLHNSGSLTVTNCTFSGNYVRDGGSGGGMLNSGDPTLTNCTFSGNSARRGGGMYNSLSSPTVTNCTFSGNFADRGGGMYNYNSSPTLTNCTFSGNSANYYGGGMYNRYSSLTVTNCILWGNTASSGGNEIYNYDTSSIPVISYCDIAGCDSSGAGWDDDLGDDGGGNIDADPFFMNASNDDLRLLPTSPCIDAGDNTAVPPDTLDLDSDGDTAEPIPIDLAGNPRFVDQPEVPDTGNGTAPIVDTGAYEANYIEVEMKFTPQALNLGSKGNWVKAHFVLPEGFDVEDVDSNSPAKITEPVDIASDYIDVFVNDGLVEIEAAFSRSDFCGAGIDYGPAEVVVIGKLISGQDFYGTDTIKIITNGIKYLAVLSSYWLNVDCGKPDWCGGVDLDQNAVVDFVDFAMFDGCCIEFVQE